MFAEFIEPGIPTAIFWLFVGIAVIIQGISKSGFAGGAGILSLPLMILVMPIDKVAATLLPILILCDLNAIYHHRSNQNWRLVMGVFLPSIIGIVFGAAVWWWVGQEGVERYGTLIKRFVGCIAIVFAVYIGGKEAAMGWVERIPMGPTTGIMAGVAAGFTSTIAHAAGPIVSLYLFAQGMGKTLLVGTVAWTFFFINLTKFPFYLGVGLVGGQELLFAVALVWLVPIGSTLGRWLHDGVSEKRFNRIIMVLVFLGGLQLVLNVNLILYSLALLAN